MYIHTYIVSQTCSEWWISKLGGYKLFLFDASRKCIRFLGGKEQDDAKGRQVQCSRGFNTSLPPCPPPDTSQGPGSLQCTHTYIPGAYIPHIGDFVHCSRDHPIISWLLTHLLAFLSCRNSEAACQRQQDTLALTLKVTYTAEDF